jgi:hypothetical protein
MGLGVNGWAMSRWHRLSWLTRIGWSLYLISLVTPGRDLKSFGAQMFILVPMGANYLMRSAGNENTLFGLALMAGWAANITAFVRVPIAVRAAAILAAWGSFAAFLLFEREANQGAFQDLFAFPCFFPWALGLTFIHAAHFRGATLAQNAVADNEIQGSKN